MQMKGGGTSQPLYKGGGAGRHAAGRPGPAAPLLDGLGALPGDLSSRGFSVKIKNKKTTVGIPPQVGFQMHGKSRPGVNSTWAASPGKRPGRWASKLAPIVERPTTYTRRAALITCLHRWASLPLPISPHPTSSMVAGGHRILAASNPEFWLPDCVG